MKSYLQKIRSVERKPSLRFQIFISVGMVFFGLALGVLQKYLDSLAFNELPWFLQAVDITNFFGRLAIWIFLATLISVYSATPLRASVNTFLFFMSMLAGYYAYSQFVLGFLSVSYMLIWIAVSIASFFLAYICWYAKGKGIIAVAISAVISGVLLAQAFIFVHGFGVTHIPEVIIWLAALIVLRRKPKEFALQIGISLIVCIVYQLFIPYWG